MLPPAPSLGKGSELIRLTRLIRRVNGTSTCWWSRCQHCTGRDILFGKVVSSPPIVTIATETQNQIPPQKPGAERALNLDVGTILGGVDWSFGSVFPKGIWTAEGTGSISNGITTASYRFVIQQGPFAFAVPSGYTFRGSIGQRDPVRQGQAFVEIQLTSDVMLPGDWTGDPVYVDFTSASSPQVFSGEISIDCRLLAQLLDQPVTRLVMQPTLKSVTPPDQQQEPVADAEMGSAPSGCRKVSTLSAGMTC